MANLSKLQVAEIIRNAPPGTTPQGIVASLRQRGHVLEGYPIEETQVEPEGKTGLEKTSDALDTVFGGKKIGEAIGTGIAKLMAKPEERQYVSEGPKASEVVGDAARTALTFAPVGKVAGVASKVLGKIGLGKAAGTLGNVVAGAGTGAAADVAVNMAEGKEPKLGLGTILGAGIPLVSPISKALSKAVGKVGSEIQGALTGTSAETFEQAFNASRKGGSELEQFTTALRGKTTPEALVNTVRENIGAISAQKQQLFRQTLDELGDTMVDTTIAKNSFKDKITKTGITINKSGLLNFDKSKLKLVPSAQTKLQTAWQEVKNLPNQVPLGELDTTRQAIKALSLAGDDPSANLANKLLDDAVRGVRQAGETVKGYGRMLDNFGETSQFLDEVERGLSTGDRATIDQAYRKLSTALKTNNEQRMALIKELDEATGGSILSSISGQQLSELMPRGIFRQISAGFAGGAILSGGISSSILPALVFASPRVSGEFVRGLGIAANKAGVLIDAIASARNVLIKAGAIGGAIKDSSNLEEDI